MKPPAKVSGASVVAPPKPLVDAQAFSLRTDQLEYLEQILLAVAIGVLAALGNLGFRSLIEFFSWVFRTLEWNALGIRDGSATVLLIPIILVSGAAAILLLNYFFPGDVLGYGFPNFLEMVNLGQGRIKRRWIVVKALGAALSLGAGASVGREGPIAQIGGAIGSAVAQMRRLSVDRAKVLIAAGAGAGIATKPRKAPPLIAPIKNTGPKTPPGAPESSEITLAKNFAAASANSIARPSLPLSARSITG